MSNEQLHGMGTEVIRDYGQFLSLSQQWNSLLERCAWGSVFLSHEWLRCWWESYAEDKKLLVLLCKKAGLIKAIAPLMIHRCLFYGFPVRTISFIENDETPHCGLLVDKEISPAEALPALFHQDHFLSNGWDILKLRRVRETDPLLDHLRSFFHDNGFKCVIRPSIHSPVLIIDRDWKSFYSSKSQRFRRRSHYIMNKLKREGEIKVRKVDNPEEISALMNNVFRVGKNSWKEKIENSIGSRPETRRFFSLLPGSLARDKYSILLWILELNDEMIAFEYHVRDKNTVYALRGEFDEKYRSVGPGSVLDFEVVRRLFEEGVKTYNMCGSADEYKLRWTSAVLAHYDMIVFNKSLYGNFLAFLENGLKPIIKRVVQLRKVRRLGA